MEWKIITTFSRTGISVAAAVGSLTLSTLGQLSNSPQTSRSTLNTDFVIGTATASNDATAPFQIEKDAPQNDASEGWYFTEKDGTTNVKTKESTVPWWKLASSCSLARPTSRNAQIPTTK